LTNSLLRSNGDFTDLCKKAAPAPFFSGLELAYPLKNPGAVPGLLSVPKTLTDYASTF